MNDRFLSYRKAATYLSEQVSIHRDKIPTLPKIGIICGSGLSGLSDTLTNSFAINYADIPSFPKQVTVQGHKGEIVFGLLGGEGEHQGVPTMCFRGRFHSYEGHDMDTVAMPVRVMRCLGVKFLIVTNAAGGLNASYNVGDIVNVMDHFALPMLVGRNPLIGPNDDALGVRFPPTSNMYDSKLQDVVIKVSNELQMTDFVRTNGTYCFVSGPMYESKAECRFLRSVGGDSVGMSTVPELLAAHHCGMKFICLSLITNKVIISGDEGPPASHGEVLDATQKRAIQMQDLVKSIVHELVKGGVLDSMTDLEPITIS